MKITAASKLAVPSGRSPPRRPVMGVVLDAEVPGMRLFLSYRREDAVALAGRIYDRLALRYGKESVFLDFADIPVGQDFVQVFEEAIEKADVFLALIGPRWLALQHEKGSNNAEDHATNEIAFALAHSIRVIPVLLGEAVMPSRSDLPQEIASLTRFNAARIAPDDRFDTDFERLVADLPAPSPDRTALWRRWWAKLRS